MDLFKTLRVVALPTKTNFRGVTIREVALFEGEYGWAEFSPFLEYDDAESAPWLACAIEAATTPKPKLYRREIAVNGTIPALNDKNKIEELLTHFQVSTFKSKSWKNIKEDIARINVVRVLRPTAKIKSRCKRFWSVDDAIRNFTQYENIGPMEYVEQPCATIDEFEN
jgi:o-succinylbenzoate synthase